MPLSPAAIGIVLNEDKTQVLLVQRKDIPIWVLPGGGLENQETAESAVMREIREETGLSIEIERQSAEYTPINRLSALTFVFVCQIKEGIPTLSSETRAIRFFQLNQLPSLFFDIHREWLTDALSHSSIVVRKPLSQITYKAFARYLFFHPTLTLRYLWTRIRNKG